MNAVVKSHFPFELSYPRGSARPLVIGNWKMNGTRDALLDFAREIAAVSPGCDAGLCVPHTLLAVAQTAFFGTEFRWGAQDCSDESVGGCTGDISARMISEFRASYVLVGHADRRRVHQETDGQVAAKVKCVLACGMTPILCVGESREERDANQTKAVLRRQLMPVIRALANDIRSIVIAYEPLWAIGSGEMAAPGLIEDAHAMIAEVIDFNARHTAHGVRILYGGSVSPGSASAVFERRFVAGALVGQASLKSSDFIAICRAAAGSSEHAPWLVQG
jgi:triosephosphate isomerase